MGERLAYLPSAGICLLVALCWAKLLEREKKIALAALVILVAALGARTLARNRDWRDNSILAESMVRTAPGSAKAHTKMGDMYLSHKQNELARKELDTALQIYPGLPDTMADYGLLEFREGNYQLAGQMMETALNSSDRTNPNYDFMAVNYAGLLMQTGHLDAALDRLNQEIKESPNYARGWSNRAVIHYTRGNKASALADAQKALLLDPTSLQAVAVLQKASRQTAVSQTENTAK
jgi:Tfp pilus assembly protein PilF